MSKFFEALEQAEQERVRQEEAKRQQTRQAGAGKAGKPAPMDAAASAPRRSRVAAPQNYETSASQPRRWELDGAARDGIVEDHLVSLLNPASAEAEEYRTLCCALEQSHRDANLSVIAITSPGVGDGKTVTAINIASTLAQTPENRVLLIDADLRHPSVASHLGMYNFEGPGLIDAILNPDVTLERVERRLSSFNVSIVPAGQVIDPPYEALKSARIETLIEDARRRYDYVIVDTPPVVPVPDCRVIARWVEGFLIVVAAHQTPKKMLEETLNIVDPNKVIGLVFNGDDLPLSQYYGYRYTADRYSRSRAGWSERLARRFAAPQRATFPLAQK